MKHYILLYSHLDTYSWNSDINTSHLSSLNINKTLLWNEEWISQPSLEFMTDFCLFRLPPLKVSYWKVGHTVRILQKETNTILIYSHCRKKNKDIRTMFSIVTLWKMWSWCLSSAWVQLLFRTFCLIVKCFFSLLNYTQLTFSLWISVIHVVSLADFNQFFSLP